MLRNPSKQPLVRKNRTLNLVLEFDKGVLNFDESPIKHTFVARNDIAETIAERDIKKLKPKTIFNLMKKIK